MSPLPDLKLKVATNLPASITYGVGVSVEKQNGIYNFLLDYSQIGQEAAIPAADYPSNWQLFWNAQTNKFTLIPYTLPTAKVTGTSTTSAAVSTGVKNFTVEQDIGWAAGMRLRASDVDDTSNYIEGAVVSYDPATGALAINVDRAIGSGTYTNWSFGVVGDKGLGDVAAANYGSEYSGDTAQFRTNVGIDANTVGLVSTIANLKTLSTASFNNVKLTQSLREGTWSKQLASGYTADIAADTNNGFIVQSTSDPTYCWVRDVPEGVYEVDWFRTAGANKAADTAAAVAAFSSVPSGAKVKLGRFKEYDLSEMSVTTRGHLHIDGNLAFINNTTQVATGIGVALPLLRVFVRTQDYDLTIENLFLQGPRLSSDTTVGNGGYGGDPLNPGSGFSSGIDVPIGRNVVLRNVVVTGTYFAGIEAHYCKSLLIDNCGASNHGYAGILFTDTAVTDIVRCTVDDTGSTAVVDGYGITAATSYNSPGYAYGNGIVRISSCTVTRCKRKNIDVHSGLRVIIWSNIVKGFGYSGIYAVCEDVSKIVGEVIVADNIVAGDATFLSGVINNCCINVGGAPGMVNDTNVQVRGNTLKDLTAPVGILFTNGNTADAGTAVSAAAQNNTFANCTFAGGVIRSDIGTKNLQTLSIIGNTGNVNVGSNYFIIVQNAVDALSTGNMFRGTGNATATTSFSGVTNANAVNNMNNGVLGA